MSRFHPEYMPKSKTDCGYCYYLELYDTNGVKSYCPETKTYCYLYEHCKKFKDGGRTERELREHCTWHVSTMIGEILGQNLDEKPFSSIKRLRSIIEIDEDKKYMISLYDTYGILIATNLYFDPNNKEVASSFLPVLNQVSSLIDDNKIELAFELYCSMVLTLYQKYNHNIDQNLNVSKVFTKKGI